MSVSVILKTLNEEARIGMAIDSVLAALKEIGGEVIVADSGSADRTLAIASAFPIRVVQLDPAVQPSCGIGGQLGYQYSSQSFVCLMDGDMLLDPDFLPEALAYLQVHPFAAGVTGYVQEMNHTSLEYVRRGRRVSPENGFGSIDRMNGGGLYRRTAIEQVGYLSDRNLHGYEEFDLGLRLRARGWTLHRLDRRFVYHFGHSLNAYALLVRRWNSGYLRGIGEVLRASLGQAHRQQLLRDAPELRLWGAVYTWWIAMAMVCAFAPTLILGLAIDAVIILMVVGVMALRMRSFSLGLYAIVAWFFHAAALPLGLLEPRRPPHAWIESRVVPSALPETVSPRQPKSVSNRLHPSPANPPM